MFGNSKEYQDLQKLYVDEVSKPENIDEFFGLGKKKKEKNKEVNITPLSDRDKSDIKKEKDIENYDKNKIKEIEAKAEKNKTKGIGPVVDNPITPDTDEKKEYGKKLNQIKANKEAEAKKKEAERKSKEAFHNATKETDPSYKYIKSNEGPNRVARGLPPVPLKPVKSPMEAGMGPGAAKARAMAKARIAAKKANPDQKQLSGRERAQAMAMARIEAKKKAAMSEGQEEYTPYDIVLEYLLSSQQAATIEEANYVMTEMDAQTIRDIVEMDDDLTSRRGGDAQKLRQQSDYQKFLDSSNKNTKKIESKKIQDRLKKQGESKTTIDH